jgi:hypothetical protein
MYIFFQFVSFKDIMIFLQEQTTLKWNKSTYKKAFCFFSFKFCLLMWHGTKIINVLMLQNDSKLYVVYDVCMVYTNILDFDHWIKIKMVVNYFISRCIFTTRI